jgi:hypothetical protein
MTKLLVTPIDPQERGYGRLFRARMSLADQFGRQAAGRQVDSGVLAGAMTALMDHIAATGRTDDGTAVEDALDDMTMEELGAAILALFADVDAEPDPTPAPSSPPGPRGGAAVRRGGSGR